MKRRVLTSIAIILACIPILLLSKYIVYPAAISLISAIAVFEILRVLGFDKNTAVSIPAYVVAAGLPVIAYFLGADNLTSFVFSVFALYLVLVLYYFTLAVLARGKMSFAKIAEAIVLTVYVTLSFTAMTLIRYIPNGAYIFALIFLGPWSCDTFAYLFGSKLGKHKLIVEISPKKTVEGSVAGIVFCSLTFLLYGLIIDLAFDMITVNYIVLAISGLVMSLVSQIGDLIASLVKREYGVKDYGNLFPGHGGIMDRFDSILASATPFLLVCMAFPPFK